MNNLKTALAITLSVLPGLVFAAPANFKALVDDIIANILTPVIGLLGSLAIAAFIWGIVKYIFYAADEKQKVSAKNTMLYGVLGLFVLFSFWGIVEFIKKDIFG